MNEVVATADWKRKEARSEANGVARISNCSAKEGGDPPQIGTLYRVIAVLLFVIAAVLLFGHDATEASLISGMERPGGHCCN
jgi:hypothetical protein